jgi:histidyl-tRNA synthetase
MLEEPKVGLSKKPYKGTRDFFPKDKRVLNFLMDAMHRSARQFGYENYDGPLLEEVELYKAKSGEELINDQIYSFNDRGERFVAIRPEMTPTLARMVAQVVREAAKPLRWYAIPNLMRYERPQRGRLREHWQFNCDIFGQEGKYGELEILQLACHLMNSFGATSEQFEFKVNDRDVVDYIFKSALGLADDQAYKLYKLVDRAKKVKPEVFEKDLSEIVTDSSKQEVFKKYLALNSFDDLKSLISELGGTSVTDEFFQLVEMISTSPLKDYVVYDPYIVRGLDYYTGLVFEIFDKHPDNRRAICGGGSYRELLKIFGEKEINATGFGLGDVTLRDFLESHGLLPDLSKNDVDILVSVQTEKALAKVSEISQSLRAEGISVLSHYSSLKMKKSIQTAEKNGCAFMTILGDDELEKNIMTIKNLKAREQKEFPLNDMTAIKNYILGE